MRQKPYVFILSGLVLLFALGFLIYSNRPIVKAEGFEEGDVLVMDNKTWNLQFSSTLQEHTVTSDNIFVKDSNGKRVNVSIRLNDNHQGVQILPPVNGYSPDAQYYTLHVTPDVKTDWGFPYNGDTKIMFSVTSQLPSIHSKQELTRYFKKIIKKQKEQSAKFSRGFSEGDMESKTSEDRAGTNASNHSTTNNQVQGVDEGDMVKTDGTYIYQLINQKLVITKANPVKDMKVLSTLSYKKKTFSPSIFFYKKISSLS